MKTKNNLLGLYLNIIISFYYCNSILGQGQPGYPDYIPDLAPVPPNVYEFIKYGDMPVSEYTGIPEIKIPVYTIKEGELIVPIELKYHAGGIKVKEEASWVGLGWSLNFGNITQMVNDRDDFGEFEKILPDPTEKPYPSPFTLRYDYMGFHQQNTCPISNGEVNFYYSYPYFTDYEYPINGDWSPMNNPYLFNGIGWITNPSNPVDSEPDIFKATFFDHDLEFIIEFGTDNIKILNTKLYKILKLNLPNNGIGWKITDPSGNRYYFEQCDVTYLDESWYESYGGGSGIIDDRVENRVWSITKIETYDEREIIFSYFQTPELENLPSFSQTYHNKIKTSENQITLQDGGYWYYKDVIYYGSTIHENLSTHEIVFDVINITKQTISYLSKIEFGQGKLDFLISPRIDCAGTFKLDTIYLKQNENIIKTFSFNYDHFVGHQNGGCYGNAGDTYFENFTQEEITHRLKLISFQELITPPYIFTYYEDYDLPRKTSFASDYWGYYNGSLNNNSLIPNPSQFNVGSSNNNNKSANFYYTRSGTIKRIDYPTGGYTKFYFQLNSFNNYWVPDFDNINNELSHGLGLRVNVIEDFSDGSIAKKVEYSYENGKAITPLKIFSDPYYYSRIKQLEEGGSGGGGTSWKIFHFTAWQGTSNNFHLPSLFGSGNYVGYGKVSVTEKGVSNNNGKRVYYFANNPDIYSNQLNELISLPTLKHKSYEHNGLILKEEIYNCYNELLKETLNNYSFEISDIYYGMKTSFYDFITWAHTFYGQTTMYLKEQDLGVFYAIYSGQSILNTTITTLWYDNIPVITEKSFTYNSINLLETETFQNSESELILKTYKYPFNYSAPYMNNLTALNRINRIVFSEEKNNNVILRSIKNSYFQDNVLIMPHSISESKGSNPYFTVIIYDDYDIKGNLTQYHFPPNNFITYLWGYNYSDVVAKIENATFNEVISSLGCTYEELQNMTTAQLLSIFDDLRNALPDAFIISYTHAPLIGPTNISDVNGLRTRFSFDDLERLKTISDNNYKILQHIDYNYYNPE